MSGSPTNATTTASATSTATSTSTPSTSAPPTPVELTTIASIRARYELPGQHATAVIQVPLPGAVGDDLGIRWSAIEAKLLGLGTSAQTVELMADLLASTHRRGHPLLLTANDDSAACCWLGFDFESFMRLGTLPALVPALHQAALVPAPIIGAVIDRTGADLYRVGAFEIETMIGVEGEREHIHKALGGGLSQARHQRHNEVVWERNAGMIATAITGETERTAADSIVLTGDERAVQLVSAQLDGGRFGPVRTEEAGGRHEPLSPERLRRAALEFRAERQQHLVGRALEDLREELGQQDRAIAGSIEVLEAINENRVKTLFVDLVIGGRTPHVDAIVRAALAHGADVITGYDFDVRDGIAGILRMPY